MTPILNAAKDYVLKTLNEELPNGFLYHNYNHTERVVKHVYELLDAEGIEGDEAENILIAAWFHDIGFVKDPENHEEIGAAMIEEFLTTHHFTDPKRVAYIQGCIKATKFGSDPETIGQQVLVDADFSHFSSKNYDQISALLRQEWKLTKSKEYTDVEWLEENINMFNMHHRYYTAHAVKEWQPMKHNNLLNLIKQRKKTRKKKKRAKLKELDLKRKMDKARLPERGIETMFRVTMRNHINLSSIADTKANILLSVNAIIISLALSNLIPKLDNPSNSYLLVPTIIFVVFSTISMVLSVLATRPNVTRGIFDKKDVEEKKVNLLFFGNFHKMKLEDFEWAMNELMQDKEYLYSSLSKDLYFLGKVLDRKYRLLRITYTIFMIGIVVSVLAFAWAFKTGVVMP